MKEVIEKHPLDRSSYKPLYIQLSEILVEYAKTKRLKRGDVLPSENELLSMYDVSRNTVRLASERLVKMGFAKKIRGQGTFIAKEDNDCRIDYSTGFEGSIQRLGMKVKNSLLGIEPVTIMPDWGKSLVKVTGGNPVLIKRLKTVGDELLAMEERLLPAHVPDRYSSRELENENISPDLLDQYPDTQTKRFSYIFASHALPPEDCTQLGLSESSRFLCRIGEYFNALDECYMLSRLMIFSDRITLWYGYEKEGPNWVMRY